MNIMEYLNNIMSNVKSYDYAGMPLRIINAVLHFIFITIIWKIITIIFWWIVLQVYMVRWHLLILFVLSAYYLFFVSTWHL